MDPLTFYYIKQISKSVILIALVIGLAYVVFGCTYGTYNATGSYPQQENNKVDSCPKQKV